MSITSVMRAQPGQVLRAVRYPEFVVLRLPNDKAIIIGARNGSNSPWRNIQEAKHFLDDYEILTEF